MFTTTLKPYSTPVTSFEDYRARRLADPNGIVPLPNEPLVPTQGSLKVWASDGIHTGWYDFYTDIFTPESA